MTAVLDRAWSLDPQVSVRPERFGALLYHFGTRRLSFLKDPRLLTVVRSLDDAPTARAAASAPRASTMWTRGCSLRSRRWRTSSAASSRSQRSSVRLALARRLRQPQTVSPRITPQTAAAFSATIAQAALRQPSGL